MDEITYWIHTKRAPCLYEYDSIQHSSDTHPLSYKPMHNDSDGLPLWKIRKRKWVMFDDSGSSLEQQNIFFEPSGQQKRQTINICKSDSLISDIDFDIKKSSVEVKPRKCKLHKCSQTILHKKNKVITSTPIVNKSLRRSLRKVQRNVDNNQHNASFELLNDSAINGSKKCNGSFALHVKLNPAKESNRLSTQLARGDRCVYAIEKNNTDLTAHREFEDFSDVSGFTANYIRSTKLHSSITPRTLRSKVKRNLVQESQYHKQENNTVVCVNRSMNTRLPVMSAQNSLGSSQNVCHLVTKNNNDRNAKVNKGTSGLRFIDLKLNDCQQKSLNSKLNTSRLTDTLNGSSAKSTSRYPRRHRNDTMQNIVVNSHGRSPVRKKTATKKKQLSSSDRKENPKDKVQTRRSGRRNSLKIRQLDSSVLVLSNGIDQNSSVEVVNVASDSFKKKKGIPRISGMKESLESLCKKETLRETNGSAACVSDSEYEPLRNPKFFC